MYVVRLVVFFLNDTATTEIYPLPLHDALPIGDRLWEVDSGLFWIVAAVVRVLADDKLGTFWDRARAASHERGSVFAVHSVNLWQGFCDWRRGELDEALACLRVALDQGRIWGHGDIGDSYTRAFEIACH